MTQLHATRVFLLLISFFNESSQTHFVAEANEFSQILRDSNFTNLRIFYTSNVTDWDNNLLELHETMTLHFEKSSLVLSVAFLR